MDENVKHHHFLIAGNVVFQPKDGPVGATALNGVLIQDKLELPVASLGKCQQVLQYNFLTKMEETDVEILDVVIMSITHLGHFTKEEFHQAPKGMTTRQAREEILSAMERAAEPKTGTNG